MSYQKSWRLRPGGRWWRKDGAISLGKRKLWEDLDEVH